MKIVISGTTLTLDNNGLKYPKILDKVVKLKQLRSKQLEKEEANKKAFAIIEALTDAKPVSDLPPCGKKDCGAADCGGFCKHCD